MDKISGVIKFVAGNLSEGSAATSSGATGDFSMLVILGIIAAALCAGLGLLFLKKKALATGAQTALGSKKLTAAIIALLLCLGLVCTFGAGKIKAIAETSAASMDTITATVNNDSIQYSESKITNNGEKELVIKSFGFEKGGGVADGDCTWTFKSGDTTLFTGKADGTASTLSDPITIAAGKSIPLTVSTDGLASSTAKNLINIDAAITIDAGYKSVAVAPDFIVTPYSGSAVYDGSAKPATVQLKQEIEGIGKYYMQYSADLGETWTTDAPVNAGTYLYRVNLEEGEKYTAAIIENEEWVYTVSPTEMSSATIASIDSQTYTGSELKPSLNGKVTFTNSESKTFTLLEGTDYTVQYTNNTNAGTATVTLIGIGNFANTKITNFTINPAAMSTTTVADIANQTYTGSVIEPATTVTFNGATLVKDTDYTVGYANNTNVGTATVTLTGKGNFTGTTTKNFTIDPAKVTVPTAETGLVYDGTVKTGVVLPEGAKYTLTNNTATNAGSYTATATLTDKTNYRWDVATPTAEDQSIAWSIAQADQTVTLSPTSGTVGVGGTTTFTVSDNQGTLSVKSAATDTATAEISGATVTVTGVKVGTTTITVTAAATTNYKEGTATYSVTVGEAYAVYTPSGSKTNDASTDEKSLIFYFDNNKTTWQSKTGYKVYAMNEGDNTPGWITDNSTSGSGVTIASVKFDDAFAVYKPTSCYQWFKGILAYDVPDGLSNLDTSECTNMAYMFANYGFSEGSEANEGTIAAVPDVSKFNTSKVTNMSHMFEGYANESGAITAVPNVTNWDTSSVTNMSSLFADYAYESTNYTSAPDTSKWDTAKVTDMSFMFSGYGQKATNLTAPKVAHTTDTKVWDTSKVTNMDGMFQDYGNECTTLSEVPDVSNWDTSSVTRMGTHNAAKISNSSSDDTGIFYGYARASKSLTEAPNVANWDTSSVTDMSNMFADYNNGSTTLNAVPDVSNWNVTVVQRMCNMFADYGYSSTALSVAPNFASWQTDSLTDTLNMFYEYGKNSSNLATSTLDVSSFNTSQVTNMGATFASTPFKVIDITGWVFTSGVNLNQDEVNHTGYYGAFGGCSNLTTIYYDKDISQLTCYNKNLFYGSSQLPHYSGTSVDKTYAYPNNGDSGYFTSKAYAVYADAEATDGTTTLAANSLTFMYDTNKETWAGKTGCTCYFMNYINDEGDYTNPGWRTGHANDIKSVEVKASFANYHPIICYAWFADLNNATAAPTGLEYLKTDECVSFDSMFYGYGSNVISFNSVPNVSNWDTSNVEIMYNTFAGYGAGSTTLNAVPDVSNWNMSKVFVIESMFASYGYSSTVLNAVPDVSKWNTTTANSTSSTSAFQYASGAFYRYGYNSGVLTSAPNVSTWNVSSVKYMDYLFDQYGYTSSALASVPNTSNWDTSAALTMARMFAGYGSSSTSLKTATLDVSNFNTEKVGQGDNASFIGMFACTPFQKINISGFTFNDGVNISEGVDLVSENKSEEEYSGMFCYCPNLTSILYDTDIHDTVGTSTYAFYKSTKLPHYDATTYDATYAYPDNGESGYFSPTKPTYTLKADENITNFQVKSGTTTTAVAKDGTYSGDYGTTVTIKPVLTDATSHSITKITDSAGNTYTLAADGTFSLDLTFNGTIIVSTYEAYAVLDSDSKLTFYYNGEKATKVGSKYKIPTGDITSEMDVPWYFDSPTSYVFDSSFKNYNNYISTAYWFCDSYTETIDCTNMDTSNVTNMTNMFYNCSSLTSCNVSSLNTSNVTNMTNMFYNCSSLTSCNVSSLNTSKVTNMGSMFYECNELTALDVSKWNTASVTNMSGMFYDCYKLGSLDTSNFDTSAVTNMNQMFSGCYTLATLDVSEFDTSNVKDMSYMFCNCNMLSSLNVSKLDTSNVTTMKQMFSGCSKLTSLDVSSFDTSNVENMDSMFSYCPFVSLDISNFNTKNVTDMTSMFFQCSNLISLDLTNFDITNLASSSRMFRECTSLEKIYTNTKWSDSTTITDSLYMFTSCSKLPHFSTTVDKTNAYPDTGTAGYFTPKTPTYTLAGSKVDHFEDASGTAITSKTITGSYGDTVTVVASMTSGSVPSTITDNAGNSYTFTQVGTSDKYSFSVKLQFNGTITVSCEEAYAVYNSADTSLSFYYDGNKTSRTGTLFNIPTTAIMSQFDVPWYSYVSSITGITFDSSFKGYSGYISTSYWFAGCNNDSLNSIDCSNMDTSNVTNMSSMFYNCTKLTSLDVSSFDTSKVTNMSMMFYGCSKLATIYCNSDWSTSSTLTSSSNMFKSCSALTGGNGTTLQSDVTKTYAKPDVPGQKGYFTAPFAVMDTGDATIDAVPTGWTSFTEDSTTKYWKPCYGTGASTDIATVIATFNPTYTFDGKTYTTPLGGYNPSSGTITGRQDIEAVWATMNYQVTIWGIGQDRTSDSVSRITFGPATGATNACLDVDGHSTHSTGKRCIHTDSWATIIDNINNRDADCYSDCLTSGCTKSVPIYYNSTIGTNPTSTTYASTLCNSMVSTYTKWNNSVSSSEVSNNWATSRMRATLNGYNNSWQSFTPSSCAGTDYLNSTNCLLSCFPKILQNNIKTKTYTVPTNWSASSPYTISDYTSVEDKLFLFNAMEVYSGITSSGYPYYYYSDSAYGTIQYTKKANESTSMTNYSNNIVYSETGSAYHFWLRCPSRYKYERATYVFANGSLQYGSVNGEHGVAPGFVL